MRTRVLWLLHLVTLLGMLLMMAGCPPAPVNPPPDADAASSVDAAPAPTPAPSPNPTGCQAWCDHAKALGCSAADPTPGGATCAEVCTNTLDGPVPLNVACRAAAKTCAAADSCEDGIGARARAAPATCSAWCARATTLKCPAAKPTPGGASCVDVCTNANSGPAKWNLKCRVAAKTCAAADACERGR
jgi:hypothetical protein